MPALPKEIWYKIIEYTIHNEHNNWFYKIFGMYKLSIVISHGIKGLLIDYAKKTFTAPFPIEYISRCDSMIKNWIIDNDIKAQVKNLKVVNGFLDYKYSEKLDSSISFAPQNRTGKNFFETADANLRICKATVCTTKYHDDRDRHCRYPKYKDDDLSTPAIMVPIIMHASNIFGTPVKVYTLYLFSASFYEIDIGKWTVKLYQFHHIQGSYLEDRFFDAKNIDGQQVIVMLNYITKSDYILPHSIDELIKAANQYADVGYVSGARRYISASV